MHIFLEAATATRVARPHGLAQSASRPVKGGGLRKTSGST